MSSLKAQAAGSQTTSSGSGAGAGASAAISNFKSAAAEQVGTMIGEDIRAFMQSMEQIYVMATAKALAMIAEPDPSQQQAGTTLLTNIATSQTNAISFATSTATVATTFMDA